MPDGVQYTRPDMQIQVKCMWCIAIQPQSMHVVSHLVVALAVAMDSGHAQC
jgi:hypothetical protein